MERLRVLNRRSDESALGAELMLRAFSNWIGRLFAPKTDDFKALLMADLGIKR